MLKITHSTSKIWQYLQLFFDALMDIVQHFSTQILLSNCILLSVFTVLNIEVCNDVCFCIVVCIITTSRHFLSWRLEVPGWQ